MKKVYTLFVIACALCSAAFAQTPGPTGVQGQLQVAPGHHHKQDAERLEAIFAKLNLTPEQKNQIAALMKDTQAQRKALRKAEKGADPVTRQAKMKEFNQNFHKQLFSILTPAQQRQFQAEMKEAKKKAREERQNAAKGIGK